jgi:glycosyltransferase involved in cell wall biosynthesis
MDGQPKYIEQDGVIYYPIGAGGKRSKLNKVLSSNTDDIIMEQAMECIDHFKPDVINVFGTERCFSLVAQKTNVPVVIHIQGMLIPYLNAYLPPSVSLCNEIFKNNNLRGIFQRYRQYHDLYKKGAVREKVILENSRYFIGRTTWDKNIVNLYNPNATYFYGGEILRSEFYSADGRKNLPEKLVIVTTISDVPYKGFDMVVKCAHIIKEQICKDFEWNVFGNIDENKIEKKYRGLLKKNNVILRGVANAETLIEYLSNCTCFVHPSYIDNSPNSVCEAQILGCPVVAQYVGGVPSLINHEETGILVPANDPYQMAIYIKKLFEDRLYNIRIGEESRIQALKRHNKGVITDNLIHIYHLVQKG